VFFSVGSAILIFRVALMFAFPVWCLSVPFCTGLKRYDSIWSDPARECWGVGIRAAGSLRIETFEGSRSRLVQTRAITGFEPIFHWT
jgi:hypothetical protein